MHKNTYALMVKINYTDDNGEQKRVSVARNIESEISNAALQEMIWFFPEDERYMNPFMNADEIIVTCKLIDRGSDWDLVDEELNSDKSLSDFNH